MGVENIFVLGALGLGMIVVLAVVFVIVYLIAEFLKDSLRFGYRELSIENVADKESFLSRLVEELRTRGINAYKENSPMKGVVVEGALVKHRIRPIGENRVALWAEVTSLAVALAIVLLLINVVVAIAFGVLAYLQYDNQRKGIQAALAALLGKDIYL